MNASSFDGEDNPGREPHCAVLPVNEQTQRIHDCNILADGNLVSSARLSDDGAMKWAQAISIALWSVTTALGLVRADDGDNAEFFLTKIAPLLETRCLECHSHATGQMENGLTLDSPAGWAHGGDNGPAVSPGEPDNSLLIEAVRYTDPDLKMPPDERLSDADIALLEEWVRRGAPDPREPIEREQVGTDWWSLNPLVRPDVPESALVSSSDNPLDLFIEQKLFDAELAPVVEADRRTLIRRLYFDLHGLPPTPEAVRLFLNDPDPLAYERLVDQLLDSPRYGERWARHWLDVIHFADSHGCEHDVKRPNAWRFRDYVIDRFNQDVSWGRFIREQLAADVFFPDEPQLTAALGFIAAGPFELSRASTAPVTFDYLDRDDMVTQTMAAFVSTTANCARCHTHKFDPITQEDYYALQAVFAGIGKGDVEYDTTQDTAIARRKWTAILAAAQAGDADVLNTEELRQITSQWEANFTEPETNWQPLKPDVFFSSNNAALSLLDDASVLATGTNPDTDTYTVTASPEMSRLTGIRLDVLPDPSLPEMGPGRPANGNFHLSEISGQLFLPEAKQATPLKFQSATADWNQDGWTIEHAIDGNPKTAWGIFPRVGESHFAVFELESPIDLPTGSRLAIALKQLHGGSHIIGRFKISVTDAPSDTFHAIPLEVAEALQLPATERTPQQQSTVTAYAAAQHAEKKLSELPPRATVYGVSTSWLRASKLDQPAPPRTVHLLRRGSIDQPVHEVSPGTLSAITALPSRFELNESDSESQRRAALAEWIASPDNPLTWRSIVNRVWQYHFGRGITDTANDFGRMGSPPIHPEMLDWLAAWFRDDAQGSVKSLHRLILTSSAWKRASVFNAATRQQEMTSDADNRLLWRMTRSRMDAGVFRDSILQLCGRLDLTTGGPGVEHFATHKGPQSTPRLEYGEFDWNSDAARRRSIYRVVWREIPDPFMEALDFPDLGLLVPKRRFSVSALQSLALFNNEFVLHASEWLADRLQQEYSATTKQIQRATELVWLRQPTESEQQAFEQYVTSHGLAAFCRVLFNSNEFLFID